MSDTTLSVSDGTFKWTGDSGELLKRLQGIEDNQFAMEVTRDVNDGRSFSAEMMEQIARTAVSFVLARCDTYWKKEHEPPTKLKLVFVLSLDHERGDDKVPLGTEKQGDGPVDH